MQFSELCCSSGHALFTTNSPSECVEKYFLKYPQRLLQKSLKRSLSPLYFLEFYKGVKRNLVGQGEGGGVRRGRRMMFIPWRAEWKTLKKRVAFGSPYCLIAIAIAIAIPIVCVCVCVSLQFVQTESRIIIIRSVMICVSIIMRLSLRNNPRRQTVIFDPLFVFGRFLRIPRLARFFVSLISGCS